MARRVPEKLQKGPQCAAVAFPKWMDGIQFGDVLGCSVRELLWSQPDEVIFGGESFAKRRSSWPAIKLGRQNGVPGRLICTV